MILKYFNIIIICIYININKNRLISYNNKVLRTRKEYYSKDKKKRKEKKKRTREKSHLINFLCGKLIK